MRDSVRPCPGPAEIERLAAGEPPAPATAAHIDACAECRARVEAARDEQGFLTRVRTVARAGLSPEGAPRIPGYRVLGVISSGSQGVVHRAVQESTSRTVAIKTIGGGPTTGSGSARHRYRAEREAEIAARLRHPNIVSVYESRKLADGHIAVVMEFVDGVRLDEWRPPAAAQSERLHALLRVFISVCSGVHHAHLNGVIHRDLKPDNILVTPDARPVILDFGVAKAGGLHATLTGEFAGTPAYASPEQVAGKPDDVDALTDVYSLGVILYRLVCSAMPYELSGSIYDAARTITEVEPVPPRRRDPGVPADLEAVILRALSKDKARRYQSAASLARDLERYLSGAPVEARSGSGWYVLRKAVALNRRRLAWAGAALVVLLASAGAVAVSLSRAAEASRRADLQREQARAEGLRARAVTEFLRDALPSVDPERPEFTAAVNAGLNRLHFRLETGAFADDPDLDQAVRRIWGGIYTGLGSGKAAGFAEYSEVSLRSGLVSLRLQHAAEHPEIASTLHELASVLMVRGRLAEAEQTCSEAITMRGKLLGRGAPATLASRALLARILSTEGRPTEAAREASDVLSALRRLPAAESDLAVASMVALLAHVELEAGAPARAEPLIRESLTIRLRRLPPEDPDLLATLADAARLADLDPTLGISTMLARAWDAEPPSPAVLRDIALLRAPDRGFGTAPIATGRSDALGRLIRFQESLLGPDDPSLVGALMAQVIAAQGESMPEVRAAAALRAADILQKRPGASTFGLLVCLTQAASVYAFTDRPERSVPLAQRACDVWAAVPDAARDNLLAASARRRLAWCLCVSGRHEEAMEQYRRALADFQACVGPDHHTTAFTESGLALCLAETGSVAEADRLSAHALELALRKPTPPDQVHDIRVCRAHVLRCAGRYAEAMREIELVWEPFLARGLPSYVRWRMIAQDAAECCEALGDLDAARVWRERADPESASRLPRPKTRGPGD